MFKKLRFLFLFLFLLVACYFLSSFKFDNLLLTKSFAASSSDTASVVFYGDDRLTPIYEVSNFRIGNKLNSNNNQNIISNSSFVQNSNGKDVYVYNGGSSVLTVDDWYLRGGNGTSYTSDGYLLSAGGWGAWFIQTIDASLISNQSTYYLEFSFENVGSSATFIDFGWQNTSFGNNSIKLFNVASSSSSGTVVFKGSFYLDFEQPTDFLSYYVRIYNQTNGATKLNYVSLSLQNPSDYSYFNFDYLKRLYLQQSVDFSSISDFDLLFTDDYYAYSQYFDKDYRISKNVSIYCVGVSSTQNLISSTVANVSSSSSSSIFSDVGDNLLNDINLSAIDLNYTFFDFSDYLVCSMRLNSLPVDYSLGHNFRTYVDLNGNTFYFYCFAQSGAYGSSQMYFLSFYLYDYDLISDVFVVPQFPFTDFVSVVNNKFVIFNGSLGANENVSFSAIRGDFQFSINYNMQYYYADYFGVSILFDGVSSFIKTDVYLFDAQNRVFTNWIDSSVGDSFYLLKSDYLQNSLIENIRFEVSVNSLLSNGLDFSSFNSLSDFQRAYENKSFSFSLGNPKIFFANSNSETSSSIVPTTTDGLYKQKDNWYDFTTDIYNFFIYIIFDAPIISDITQLIYIIVSLFIKVIELVISLFSGLGSTIFSAAIVGFLVFKFIINKFLGGKD